jgi:anion-transporting  ArsA/GET3 family ATPase
MTRDLFDRQFLFVVGKGGVGKTTVSTALALAAARRGKRVLLTMCNAKERVSQLLGVGVIDHVHREVAPGVDAVNMTPDAALEEYGMMVLRVRALYRAVFENKFVRAFLRGTPGIDAWSMLGKAYFHATQDRLDDGRPRYDLVILDAPATGHGLDMLRVPRVIVDVAPPGLLRREAEGALALFQDEHRAGVVVVTLPEDMPVNETLELHAALRHELRMPVLELVVNRVLPPLFPAAERAVMEALPAKLGDGSPLAPLAAAAHVRAVRERVQAESLERLERELPVPRVILPRLFVADFGRAEVETLAARFHGQNPVASTRGPA